METRYVVERSYDPMGPNMRWGWYDECDTEEEAANKMTTYAKFAKQLGVRHLRVQKVQKQLVSKISLE